MEQLGADAALQLLGTVEPGRIVFTRHALPDMRPVSLIIVAGNSSGGVIAGPCRLRQAPDGAW